jgi:RNA polymerase sigma factor (sigma-70 family)
MSNDLEKLSDHQLLLEMKNANGDFNRYFNVLYDRYNEGLYIRSLSILGNKQDAEDNVQETFKKVYQGFRSFDYGKAKFLTWIYRVSVNNAIDKLRRRKSKESLEICFSGLYENIFTSRDTPVEERIFRFSNLGKNPEEFLLMNEKHEILRRCLNSMKYLDERKNGVDYRNLLNLFYFKGDSHKKLSEKFGINVGTVKKRLNKARRLLEEKLSRETLFINN